MIETWLARTFSILAALVALFVTGGGFFVFHNYYRRWRYGQDESFNSQAWTAIIVAVALDAVCFAILDVGQAFALVSEAWGAIVGIIGTVLLPILGYKSVQAVQASKGVNNVTGGGAP